MTNLQAEYSKIVEQRRHNLATEKQTDTQLTENQRHNLRTEQLTDAQNLTNIRGQDINASLTQARMLLDESISDKQMANARWLEQYKQQVNTALTKLKNDTELYKTAITKQNNLANQMFKGKELENQTAKTNADISKIAAEIEKFQKEVEIKQNEFGLDLKKYYNDSVEFGMGGKTGISFKLKPIALIEGSAEQITNAVSLAADIWKSFNAAKTLAETILGSKTKAKPTYSGSHGGADHNRDSVNTLEGIAKDVAAMKYAARHK